MKRHCPKGQRYLRVGEASSRVGAGRGSSWHCGEAVLVYFVLKGTKFVPKVFSIATGFRVRIPSSLILLELASYVPISVSRSAASTCRLITVEAEGIVLKDCGQIRGASHHLSVTCSPLQPVSIYCPV